VRETRRGEEEVARLETVAPPSVHEIPDTLHHDISLVPGVRLLGVRSARRVQLDRQAPAFKHQCRPFAGWPGKTLLDLRVRAEALSFRIDPLPGELNAAQTATAR